MDVHHAFNGCSSLRDLTIPSSVKLIGNFAFNNCSLLKDLQIPSSVKSIGKNAFKGCCSFDIQMDSSNTNHHFTIDDFNLLNVLGIGSYGKV